MRYSSAIVGLGAVLALAASSGANAGVSFNSGVYPVAGTCSGFADVPANPCETGVSALMTISVSSGTVTVGVTNDDASSPDFGDTIISFSFANNQTPLTYESGGSPVFTVTGADITTTSGDWNQQEYPYVTFWSATDGAGLTIGDQPGDNGDNLVQYFESGQTENLFSVPEPAAWSLMLIGAGLVGGALRRRVRPVAA